MVEAVLAVPRARHLHRLGFAHVGRTLEGDLTGAVGVLLRHRPRSLRELVLGDHPNWHGFTQTGDIAALWPAIASVTRLALNGDFTLGDFAAPAATHVEAAVA